MENQSLLTFNMSVGTKKDFMLEIEFPVQIMPSQFKFIQDSTISNYPSIPEDFGSVIHTSYITKPFSPNMVDKLNNIRFNIEQYIKLGKKINYNKILIHGPSNIEEFNRLDIGMSILAEIFNKHPHSKLLIEIPPFGNDMNDYISEKFDIEDKNVRRIVLVYFDNILHHLKKFTNGFEIVIDTAHLHAIGCDVEDMKYLYEKFMRNMTVTHLNGNKKPMHCHDEHVPIYSKENNIINTPILLTYLADKNIICICENSKIKGVRTDWEKLAEEYKFKIVPNNINLGL